MRNCWSRFKNSVVQISVHADVEPGRHRAQPRPGPTKAAEIEQWLNRVSDTFNMPNGWPRLPLLGPLMHRKSNTHYKDAMIAAIAKVHQLRVVTPNLNDFSRFDVPLLYPFSDGLTPR